MNQTIDYSALTKAYEEALASSGSQKAFCGLSFVVACFKQAGYTQEEIDIRLDLLQRGEEVEGFALVEDNMFRLGED